ncbi:MAG TPA: metallophosphoesterase [Chitinophagaceae bacterium]|nr:metallophosphoesterase [Chitinophagaceae bacterium]
MDSLRRDFIRQSSLLSGGLLLLKPLESVADLTLGNFSKGHSLSKVTILHTNDLHNTIEPIQLGRRRGYGGLKNISTYLKQAGSSVLLVDAGDFLDDKASEDEHRKMIAYMNRIGFSCATIGNRELANGQDYFAGLLPFIKFTLVNCNYSFENYELRSIVRSHRIIKTGKYKIGITGVGVKTDETAWHHPYEKANAVASFLKNDQNCDLVICLSHLGYDKQSNDPHNIEFAKASENIDLIIGGHTDIVMPQMLVMKNNKKNEVMISHGGPAGILAKQIGFGFDALGQKNMVTCRNVVPGLDSNLSGYDEIKRITA